MEILVKFVNLIQIFFLHFSSGEALGAIGRGGWEEELIDDNVVGVDVECGEFLNHSLSLVKGQEFRNANTDKSGQIRVLELTIDFLHYGGHFVNF